MAIEVSYKPRPEYGLIVPILTPLEGGVLASGGSGRLLLSAPPLLAVADGQATAAFSMEEDENLYFALQHSLLSAPAQTPYSQGRIKEALAVTVEAWRHWSELHQSYDGPWRELVHHSGRVLKALSYQPTVPSSPPRRPPCRSRSAGSVTGTTDTHGFGTRVSPWKPSGSPPAPTKPSSFLDS